MLNYNFIQEVELPGWEDEKPFTVKLKRPSLLAMAAAGAIPNELMASAQRLFNEGGGAALPPDKLGALLIAVAKEALCEPSWAELEQSGCCLTDMQLAAIYAFAQSGVRALEPFRLGRAASQSAGDEQALQHKAE